MKIANPDRKYWPGSALFVIVSSEVAEGVYIHRPCSDGSENNKSIHVYIELFSLFPPYHLPQATAHSSAPTNKLNDCGHRQPSRWELATSNRGQSSWHELRFQGGWALRRVFSKSRAPDEVLMLSPGGGGDAETRNPRKLENPKSFLYTGEVRRCP